MHIKHFQMSWHLEMPLLPFTLKCLPFALKNSRTSTYENTYIYVYTQLKHATFLSELYTFVKYILYVCASVLWVFMRIEFICMCECLLGVYAWIKFICICEYV